MTSPTHHSRRRFLIAAGTASIAAPASAFAAIDATDHGLAPDAAADQTAVLQAALDDAASRAAPLFLPPGRYRVTSLRLPPYTHLSGVPGASVLTAEGGAVLTADGADSVAVDGIVIDGQEADLDGATALGVFRNVGRLALDRLQIRASRASGIHMERCGGHVRDCLVEDVAETGIFSLDGHDVEIAANVVRHIGNNAIQVWQSEKREDGSRVVGNTVSHIRSDSGGDGQNGNGINVYRAGSVMASGNRIGDCAFSAIRYASADDAMITDNRCRRLGEVAIFVEFAFEGAVVANNSIDDTAHGISVTNFNDGGRLAVVSGNVVRNATFPGGGLGIAVEADTAITGNVVEKATRAGLVLGWGPYLRDVTACGNVVRACGIGIGVSVAGGAGGALIQGNTVTGSRHGAILGMQHDEIVTLELADGGDEGFPNLVVAGNRTG